MVSGVDVVVKVLTAQGAPARLEREARALARLRGVPGVLGVRELGVTPDGTAWLVTELAPGGSLADRLTESQPDRTVEPDRPDRSERTAGPLEPRRLFGELVAILAAAHERQVVHGDISPGNILFDADGSALLADFGAADLDGRSDPVGQGFTPAHAAPERRRGAAASPAGDVYSAASTVQAVLRSTGAAGHDPELDDLLGRATAEFPRSRPTAAEVARVLAAPDGRGRARPARGRGRGGRARR